MEKRFYMTMTTEVPTAKQMYNIETLQELDEEATKKIFNSRDFAIRMGKTYFKTCKREEGIQVRMSDLSNFLNSYMCALSVHSKLIKALRPNILLTTLNLLTGCNSDKDLIRPLDSKSIYSLHNGIYSDGQCKNITVMDGSKLSSCKKYIIAMGRDYVISADTIPDKRWMPGNITIMKTNSVFVFDAGKRNFLCNIPFGEITLEPGSYGCLKFNKPVTINLKGDTSIRAYKDVPAICSEHEVTINYDLVERINLIVSGSEKASAYGYSLTEHVPDRNNRSMGISGNVDVEFRGRVKDFSVGTYGLNYIPNISTYGTATVTYPEKNFFARQMFYADEIDGMEFISGVHKPSYILYNPEDRKEIFLSYLQEFFGVERSEVTKVTTISTQAEYNQLPLYKSIYSVFRYFCDVLFS